VGSGLHFFIFDFCHCGWSALWLSQTVFVFKLAHNGLHVGDVPRGTIRDFAYTLLWAG